MLSAKFAQSIWIRKSVPEQPKGALAPGRPVRGSGGPGFAEILSGAVEAAGGAEGAVGPAQAARPGHHFRLSAQTVLGALRVSVAGVQMHGNLGLGNFQPLALGVRSGPCILGWPAPLSPVGNVSLQTVLCRRSWVLLAAGTALDPTRQHHTSFTQSSVPGNLGF